MIDRDAAKTLVQKLLREIPSFARLDLVIEDINEFKYGWVFFYNTRKYVETGDFLYSAFEVEPIVVDKYDQSIHFIQPFIEKEDFVGDYLKAYEAQRTQLIRWFLRRRQSNLRLHRLLHGPLTGWRKNLFLFLLRIRLAIRKIIAVR